MIWPWNTDCPPDFFRPRRCPGESRPFLVDPAAFFVAHRTNCTCGWNGRNRNAPNMVNGYLRGQRGPPSPTQSAFLAKLSQTTRDDGSTQSTEFDQEYVLSDVLYLCTCTLP